MTGSAVIEYRRVHRMFDNLVDNIFAVWARIGQQGTHTHHMTSTKMIYKDTQTTGNKRTHTQTRALKDDKSLGFIAYKSAAGIVLLCARQHILHTHTQTHTSYKNSARFARQGYKSH